MNLPLGRIFCFLLVQYIVAVYLSLSFTWKREKKGFISNSHQSIEFSRLNFYKAFEVWIKYASTSCDQTKEEQ